MIGKAGGLLCPSTAAQLASSGRRLHSVRTHTARPEGPAQLPPLPRRFTVKANSGEFSLSSAFDSTSALHPPARRHTRPVLGLPFSTRVLVGGREPRWEGPGPGRGAGGGQVWRRVRRGLVKPPTESRPTLRAAQRSARRPFQGRNQRKSSAWPQSSFSYQMTTAEPA